MHSRRLLDSLAQRAGCANSLKVLGKCHFGLKIGYFLLLRQAFWLLCQIFYLNSSKRKEFIFHSQVNNYLVGGLRARRSSAEQGSLGDHSMRNSKSQKGGVPMVKNVHFKAGVFCYTALVVVGWIAFILGLWFKPHSLVLAVCLSSVARVLP